MENNKKLFAIVVSIVVALSAYAQTTPLPYECTFENPADPAGWSFYRKNGKGVPQFVIGSAVHRIGAHSLYVSPDTGRTAGYESTTGGYIVTAARKFDFKAGDYNIRFDYHIVGDTKDDNDVMFVAFFPAIDTDGNPVVPVSTSNGSVVPDQIKDNIFADLRGRRVFASSGWTTVEGALVVPDDGEYWLAFYFRERGGKNTNYNPGPCIDNVYVDTIRWSTDCMTPPTAFSVEKTDGDVEMKWNGSAPQYELLYYSSASQSDTAFTVIKGITGNSYSIPIADFAEGCYTFLVRSVCPEGNSFWTECPNVIIYDPTKHCLDYLNLKAPGVTCTWGTFQSYLGDPAANPPVMAVVDSGFRSAKSIHTVHYMPDEYDPMTGFRLKTVPDGAIGSVRLSNWTEGKSPSGSIEYTYTVSPDATVLLLRYAAVLQYSTAHGPTEQTRIHVEILDAVQGTLLSDCTEADFNAYDVDHGDTRGWQTHVPSPSETENDCDIKWLDWTLLGINLNNYVGKTVKIRLTLFACHANFHFAYAYFTLDCSRGDIEGMSCGKVPNKFTVPEGFDYAWYRLSDPTDTVCRTNEFIPDPTDTCSYGVDLLYPENHDCKFTLYAYMTPRLPKSVGTYIWKPGNCSNNLNFSAHSEVWAYPAGYPAYQLKNDSVEAVLWDFGNYGTSEVPNHTLAIPNEGDTFDVYLTSFYRECAHTDTIKVECPAIHSDSSHISSYMCEGVDFVFGDSVYNTTGDYRIVHKNRYGCDSTIHLHIRYLIPDSITADTTVCMGDTVNFGGIPRFSSGQYSYSTPSSLGCDSLYYELNLTVLDTLVVTLGDIPDGICADERQFEIPFTVERGEMTGFGIVFSDAAKQAGFVDADTFYADNHISLSVPDSIRPDRYSANIHFYNGCCGEAVLPLDFDILYPSSVIAQRWNDALAIKNSGHNGGYTFAAYQWYLDGTPVEGEIRSQLYTENGTLRFGSEYRVLLTRADDGVAVLTCPYTPTEFAYEEYTEVSNVVFPGSAVVMESPSYATATLYTLSGLKHSEQDIVPGLNTLTMPSSPGIYILQFRYADTRIETLRIVVK